MKAIFKLVPLAAIVGLLMLVPAALAQDTTSDAYSTPGGRTEVEVGGVSSNTGSTPTATTPTSPTASNAASTPSSGSNSGSTPSVARAEQPRPQSVASGSLPFTGLDLGLITLAGAVLLLVGVTLRRTTRRGQLSA